MSVKYPDVKVQLSGEDGNVFAVIGRVSKALKRAGLRNEAEEFTKTAIESGSYDAVLRFCMDTVDVS